jgi:hypothetical protein
MLRIFLFGLSSRRKQPKRYVQLRLKHLWFLKKYLTSIQNKFMIKKIGISQNLKEELMKLSFRTIGAIGFLLVLIGYLMPMVKIHYVEGFGSILDMFEGYSRVNGFQIATIYVGGEVYKNNLTMVGILIYLLFVFALVGIIIGVLQLKNIKVPIIIDWLVILFCLAFCVSFFFTNPDIKLAGYYIIVTGTIWALILQIVSLTENVRNKT